MSNADDLGEESDVLSEEILSVLVELADRDRAFDGSEADRTVRQALGALSSFRGKRVVDEQAVGYLAHAKSLVERGAALIEDENAKEALFDAVTYFDKIRSRAIDRMIESDRRGQPKGRASTPPDLEPMVLGLGTPALIKGVAIALPRMFLREQDAFVSKALPKDMAELVAQAEAEALQTRPSQLSGPGPKTQKGDAGERHQVEVLARDAMEDLASYSTLRKLGDEEAWGAAEAFERRLLASLDALVALARPLRPDQAELDLAEALFAYATEWIVPDRGRAFAFAITMASVASDAALLWVLMGLRRAEAAARPAYTEALALGSNPHIAEKLITILTDDGPKETTLVALEAAGRRRLFHAGAMLPLTTHPDARIASLAIRGLMSAPAELASETLSRLIERGQRLVVRAVAGETLIDKGPPAQPGASAKGVARGREVLRGVIEELLGHEASRAPLDRGPARKRLDADDRIALSHALRGLAVAGDGLDAEHVWAAAHALGSYREVGFFGHVPHVALLFATLSELDGRGTTSQDDGEARGSAGAWVEQLELLATALKRITGIDAPKHGPGRYDLNGFKRLWEEKVPTIALGRTRFGKPFQRADLLAELAAPATRQADRRLLAKEVAHHSEGVLHFDVDGWVADQKAFLKLAREAWDA